MARPALTEEQRKKTRQSIRKAAAELYQKNGAGDVSARAIADAAGVSVGTLYSYFNNLTELMQSLWKEPVKRLLDQLETDLAKPSKPLDKLERLLKAYVKFASQHRGIYRSAFMYVRPESHKQPEPVSLESDRFFSLFLNAIIEGQTSGDVRTGPPKLLAQTLWAGLHGAIALPINMDRIALEDGPQSVEQMIDLLMAWLSEP